jgi:IS30 family transposase
MSYRQVTERERYYISQALVKRVPITHIAWALERSRSTIQREINRNQTVNHHYKPLIANDKAVFRRQESRRKTYFTEDQWNLVREKLRIDWSPEQISLRFAKFGVLEIHWVTIYRQIRRDKRRGGQVFKHLRQAHKKRRKGYGKPDSRGQLRGKRNISQRPKVATARREKGHGEADLVRGHKGQGWLLSAIDRRHRFLQLKILRGKTVREVNRKLKRVIKDMGFKTLTVDNGCEFHGFRDLERATGVKFYFANAHRSWERGSIENVNGLIRQYFPKSMSLLSVKQDRCDFVAMRINQRPRKILKLKTAEECYFGV